MTYKTILVHLGSEDRARSALGFAIGLAQRFQAHLIGLYVFPSYPLTPPVPLPFGAEIAGQIRSAINEEARKVKAVFDEMTASQPFVSEWRSITTDRRSPEKIVIEQSHVVDLVVASQADPSWKWSDILDFPDSLALGAGRPVVIVPNYGRHDHVPRVVTVAWNGRREAARAVADALPLLREAEAVNVLTVRDGRPLPEGQLPDTEIAASLARHGVTVDLADMIATEYTIGEEIRVRAIDRGSDLIVMGCYGHSRLREFALGGVTRHLMREMTMPILFSH
jgi:nucleotide-binding universal stress UspA family protein